MEKKSTMLKRILYKINWYKRILLTSFGVKRAYQISNYSMQLDFTHRLPDYQNAHPFYDRFLPHLVKYLPDNTLVIDVGANVGDTLIGMLGNNDRLEYLCIEASHEFFSDLKKNVQSLRAQNVQLQISIVNEFVGRDVTDVGLDGQGGTKHAVVGGGIIKPKTMTSILSGSAVEHSRLSLLKTDVDGFDWDVIRSSYEVLKHNPYVYFECQYDDLEQLESYRDLFSEMVAIGYSKFAFFDNYGQFILSTDDLTVVGELLDYVKRQNFHNSTRTYFYYDVLAYPTDKSVEADSIIAEYNIRGCSGRWGVS
jgi:FkbM family methyltransferase